MTANDQTLQNKAVDTNEQIPEPPKSVEARYNYQLLDLLFRGQPDELKNTGLEQDKPYQHEKAPANEWKVDDDNNYTPYDEAEDEQESESGLSTLSLMPCNRYLLQRKKKPISSENYAIKEPKMNPTRNGLKEIIKPSIQRTYEKPISSKPNPSHLHLKNSQYENPMRKPWSKVPSAVTLEEAISRYIKNNNLKVLLDDNPTPSSRNISYRQIPKAKSINENFFVTEISNRPKSYLRSSANQLESIGRANEKATPFKSLSSSRPRLNDVSPGSKLESSPIHTSGIKVIKNIREKLKTRTVKNLHEVNTIAKKNKIEEEKRRRLEMAPQIKPMRYNLVKSDYNRDDSFSSRDSRTLSTNRDEKKPRNLKVLTPETKPLRKNYQAQKGKTTRNGSNSSRNFGALNTSRSIANASPIGAIPSLRIYDAPRKQLKPKVRPPNGPKQKAFEGKRIQNLVKPQQKQSSKSDRLTNLFRKEARANMNLQPMSRIDAEPTYRLAGSARYTMGRSNSAFSQKINKLPSRNTTPESSKYQPINNRDISGMGSLDKGQLEAINPTEDKPLEMKPPSHRNPENLNAENI